MFNTLHLQVLLEIAYIFLWFCYLKTVICVLKITIKSDFLVKYEILEAKMIWLVWIATVIIAVLLSHKQTSCENIKVEVIWIKKKLHAESPQKV